MAARTLRRTQAATASRMPFAGTASTATSMPMGRSSMPGTHGRPLISDRVRLTRWMSPANEKRSRFASTAPPSDPGSGDTPTIAMERGRMSGRTSSAATLVRSEAGLVAFLVEELRHAAIAALLRIEEARLVDLGEQIIFRVVPRHVQHAAIGVLRRLE